ncbi:MAG: hypothetical protein ACSW8B_05685, partial [bacterium]
FHRYKGEEPYMQMYLKTICQILDLNEEQIQQAYIALTRDKIGSADEGTSAEKPVLKDVHTTKQPSSDHQAVTSPQKESVKPGKSLLIVLSCLILAVVMIAVIALEKKPSSSIVSSTFSQQETSSTTSQQAQSEMSTSQNEKSVSETSTTPETSREARSITTKQESASSMQQDYQTKIKRNKAFNYTVVTPANTSSLRLKLVFKGRTWAALYRNGSRYRGFQRKAYRHQTVILEMAKKDLRTLRLRTGNNRNTTVYVNEKEIYMSKKDKRKSVADIIIICK